MRLVTSGRPLHIYHPIVGRIARHDVADRADTILVLDSAQTAVSAPHEVQELTGYRGVLTPAAIGRAQLGNNQLPIVHTVRHLDHLHDGDIVVLDDHGQVRTLFRPDSTYNTLFVTEQCNSNCLMCSQPPKEHDDISYLNQINREL